MTHTTAPHEWVKEALGQRGYMQRDLATSWGVSEGTVSRWVMGHERQDLPLSRARILSRMLGVTLDDLANRLGFGDGDPPSPLTFAPPTTQSLPPGTMNFIPNEGRIRVLLHLNLDTKTATEVMSILASYTAPNDDRQLKANAK